MYIPPEYRPTYIKHCHFCGGRTEWWLGRCLNHFSQEAMMKVLKDAIMRQGGLL